MSEWQRTVASLAVVALLVTSGCSMLSGPVTFSATPADVSESAQTETDYNLTRSDEMVINRTFSAAGQSKNVTVTNHLREYSRTVDLGPLGKRELARFVVFSSPQVEVAGQTFNPIGKMSNRELVQRLSSSYDSLSNIQQVSNRSLTVLGTETTVGKFSAEAQTSGGQSVDVYIHVTKVKDGEDFVLGLAVHPQQLDEQQRVDTLMGGIQHPAEE